MMVLGPVTTTKTSTMISTGCMSALKSLTICHLKCLKVRNLQILKDNFPYKLEAPQNMAPRPWSEISTLTLIMEVIKRNKNSKYNNLGN